MSHDVTAISSVVDLLQDLHVADDADGVSVEQSTEHNTASPANTAHLRATRCADAPSSQDDQS